MLHHKRIKKGLTGLCLILLVFGGLATILGSGGSDDSDPEPSVNVSGTWTGHWRSRNNVDGGRMTFVSLKQTGVNVTGQVVFTGSPCFSGGAVSGTVSGNNFSGSLTAGRIRVDFDVTVTGNRMNGTYNTINAGACTGDTGTLWGER